jgi:hypothetical protein
MAERLDALTVRESNGKSYFTKIGAAFPNKDGKGWTILLDAVPASNEGQYKIMLREPLPPRENQTQGAQGNSSLADDLDDEIPGWN